MDKQTPVCERIESTQKILEQSLESIDRIRQGLMPLSGAECTGKPRNSGLISAVDESQETARTILDRLMEIEDVLFGSTDKAAPSSMKGRMVEQTEPATYRGRPN